MRRLPLGLSIAAVVLLGSSCAIGAKTSAAPLPPSPTTVHVSITNQSFVFDPDIPAGRVVFDVVNDGTEDHSMNLVSLPEDFPPLVEQLRGTERRGTPAVARVPRLAPGERSTFAVDLKPGRYGMICFVTGPDGTSHATKGHAAEFRVV